MDLYLLLKLLLKTLQKLVDTEAQALTSGKNRKQAIYAAYDRFYRGDIAEELVRSSKEYGGLITMEDLDTSAQVAHSPTQQLLLPEATRDEKAP